ncbi:hypothetical protein Dimus_018793 [Dionaea muscipula]
MPLNRESVVKSVWDDRKVTDVCGLYTEGNHMATGVSAMEVEASVPVSHDDIMTKKFTKVSVEDLKNRGLQSALFVRQQCSKHANKVADLSTEIECKRLAEEDLRKQLNELKGEKARLEQELSEKVEENKQLMEGMTNQVMNVMIEARGTMMKEY